MNRLWLVFVHELRRSATRKGYLFATFGIPLIAAAIFFGYPVYQSMQSADDDAGNPLQELDLDQLERAGIVDFSGVFENPPERFAEVLIPYADEASARIALEAEEIDVFLVFPEDYLETGEASLHIPNLNLTLLGEGESIGTQLAYSTFATGLDEIRLSRLGNPAIFTDFDLSISNEGSNNATEDGQFLVVYVFAMVFFIGLMLTNTYLMQTVIEERDNRVLEILISSVKPTQLLAGKILALSLLGLLQIVTWVSVVLGLLYAASSIELYAGIINNLSVSLNPELFGLMAIYFVLMYLLYAAVFGTIGAVSASSQEGSQYVGFLVLPALLPFYFFSLIQAAPNGALAVGFSIFPITAPITIMARTVIASVPFWQIALSIALLIILTIGAMWMAGRIFRVQTLLSGTKLKVADIPRLIFAAD
ncbi:MAG: ABC transporter permease [Phototrophicaceae bacterium]